MEKLLKIDIVLEFDMILTLCDNTRSIRCDFNVIDLINHREVLKPSTLT